MNKITVELPCNKWDFRGYVTLYLAVLQKFLCYWFIKCYCHCIKHSQVVKQTKDCKHYVVRVWSSSLKTWPIFQWNSAVKTRVQKLPSLMQIAKYGQRLVVLSVPAFSSFLPSLTLKRAEINFIGYLLFRFCESLTVS